MLPGEEYYREHINSVEKNLRASYRYYQDWRANIGVYMTDIDILLSTQSIESFNNMKNIEYSITEPNQSVNHALIEMKHKKTKKETIDNLIMYDNPTKSLANAAKLPFFVVKYFPVQESPDGRWEFSVYPANSYACSHLAKASHMSEREYVNFLYSLRNMSLTEKQTENYCCKKARCHTLNL